MEDAILEIVAAIKAGQKTLDAEWLEKLVRRHNRKAHDAQRTVAKRRLLPYYLQVREHEPERWQAWGVDPKTETELLRLLKIGHHQAMALLKRLPLLPQRRAHA